MPVAIVPGIYPLTESLDGRALTVVLLVGEDGATLIDAGLADTPARLVLPALEALGLSPADVRQIVITHSDVDHSGGLGAMQMVAPAAIGIAHRYDIAWIEDVERLIDERYRGLRHAHAIDQSEEFAAWVRGADSAGVVHLGVLGGETLRLEAGRELEFVHVPGHSRGHLALVDWSTGTGLIGDAVFGSVTPLLDGSGAFAPGYYDVAAYRQAIARLQELKLERLVCAHYPLIEGEQVEAFLAESAAFCSRLEDSVASALEAAAAPLSTEEVIAAAAPAVRAWPPEADRSLSAAVVGHLDDLRERGLVELHAGGAVVRWSSAA